MDRSCLNCAIVQNPITILFHIYLLLFYSPHGISNVPICYYMFCKNVIIVIIMIMVGGTLA